MSGSKGVDDEALARQLHAELNGLTRRARRGGGAPEHSNDGTLKALHALNAIRTHRRDHLSSDDGSQRKHRCDDDSETSREMPSFRRSAKPSKSEGDDGDYPARQSSVHAPALQKSSTNFSGPCSTKFEEVKPINGHSANQQTSVKRSDMETVKKHAAQLSTSSRPASKPVNQHKQQSMQQRPQPKGPVKRPPLPNPNPRVIGKGPLAASAMATSADQELASTVKKQAALDHADQAMPDAVEPEAVPMDISTAEQDLQGTLLDSAFDLPVKRPAEGSHHIPNKRLKEEASDIVVAEKPKGPDLRYHALISTFWLLQNLSQTCSAEEKKEEIHVFYQGCRFGLKLAHAAVASRSALADALNNGLQGQIYSCGKGQTLEVIFVNDKGLVRQYPALKFGQTEASADQDWSQVAHEAKLVLVAGQKML